jgi:hypothetical protein
MGKELYHALTKVYMQRVHTTLTIDDFDCITEDVRYVFYNEGDTPVSLLPLPARERTIQRNMKVEDASHRTLVFIPLSSAAPLLEEACSHIIEETDRSLQEPQESAFKGIKDYVKSHLKNVFVYNPEEENIHAVCEKIAEIFTIPVLQEETFIRKIIPLINILNQYKTKSYTPLVSLIEPLCPKDHKMIRLSVERIREYLQDKKTRFKFGILGRFIFSYVPVTHKGISNHVRIFAPDGLLIKDVEFDISTREPDKKSSEDIKAYLNANKENYFDDKCFYIHTGPEESTRLYDCDTHYNITFDLLGPLRVLSLLWWLTILSPAFFGFLHLVNMLPPAILAVIVSSNFVLGLLALSAVFLVAIGIYALDKRIIRHFITKQMIFVYVVLALEITFMILWKTRMT